MALRKFGNAVTRTPVVCPGKWIDQKVSKSRMKVAKQVIGKFDPAQWLLSHCTIMAAVDVEPLHKDPKKNFLIKPEYSIFVNNNGDSWERELLRQVSKSFLGVDNFVEHIQIPSLSKGKVIDVALREVPFTKDQDGNDLLALYVDLLIATNRKHTDIIEKINSGEYNFLSMGCFLAGTEITLSDGTKRLIEDIRPRDQILTHTGSRKSVLNVQRRYKNESIFRISFEGDYKDIYVTKEHPFWAFNRTKKCACGCGQDIHAIVRGDQKQFKYSQFGSGHYAEIADPNKKVLNFKARNEVPVLRDVELEWVKASDLSVGDFLSYPISAQTETDKKASVGFARLLGYFAAEGSYVKEAAVEEKEDAVEKEKAEKNGHFIKSSEKKESSAYGSKRIHRRVGLEFSVGEHEYDTVNKEIFEIGSKLFPEADILRYPNAVKIISSEAAELMLEYVGEYSDRKRFCEKVMFWPVEYQKHLVATWFIGDYATTVSKDMFDQFRFMLARCGVCFNSCENEKSGYKCKVSVVNGEEREYEEVRKKYYLHQINTLGMNAIRHELNYHFPFDSKKSTEINRTADSFASYDKSYFLRKIKEIEEIPFEGYVYNFEVEGENSYIANDVAVHNCVIEFSVCSQCGNIAVDDAQACKHVRYFKNNFFYDKNGVKRIIAELCGSSDEPNSCKFCDASWVRKPAFEGAILRNVLQAVGDDADMSDKIQKAVRVPSFERQPGMYLKAASQAAQSIVNEVEAQDEEVPDAPKDDAGFPEAPAEAEKPLEIDKPPEEGEGEAPAEEKGEETAEKSEEAPSEAPAESPEAVPEGAPGGAPGGEQKPPEPQVEEPVEDATVKEVKQLFKKQILNELRRDLLKQQAKTLQEDRPAELETMENKSLVKEARFKKLLASSKIVGGERLQNALLILSNLKDWKNFKKYGYSRNDVLGVLHYVDANISSTPVGRDAVKVLAKSKTASSNLVPLFTEIIIETGRKPERYESKKIAAWAKILRYFEE